MNEILISILLTVPLFDSHDSWTINQVPSQVQVQHHNSCITVSYSAVPVPCDTTTPTVGQRLLLEDSEWMQECYLVLDINHPSFVKSCGYHGITIKGGEHK